MPEQPGPPQPPSEQTPPPPSSHPPFISEDPTNPLQTYQRTSQHYLGNSVAISRGNAELIYMHPQLPESVRPLVESLLEGELRTILLMNRLHSIRPDHPTFQMGRNLPTIYDLESELPEIDSRVEEQLELLRHYIRDRNEENPATFG